MGRRQDQVGGDALRQDVPRHHPQMRGAEAARRLDIGHLLQRQHDGADHPAAERNASDRDRDDHGADPGAERHRDRHRQDQVGKGLQELDDALADDVETSAEIAARQAPQGAQGGAEQHRADRDGQGCAAAVDDPAQGIAADLVGAEIMRRLGRLRHVAEIEFQRVVGRQERRSDRHHDDRGGDAAPERRQRRSPGKTREAARDAPPARQFDRLGRRFERVDAIGFGGGHR